MNHIFQLIWNASTQTYIAIAETVHRGGRMYGSVLALSVLPLGALAANPEPQQLPTGEQVSAGSAQVQREAGQMRIQQSTDRAVIDWQTFDLGRDASVRFEQPSNTSATLNRVLSSQPSQLFGRIEANGQVILTNASGAYFSPSSTVEVGALVASSLGIDTDDFMKGELRFKRDGTEAAIVNAGKIQAGLGGFVALLAPEVRNEGVIIAQSGSVALAAGEQIELSFDDNGSLLNLEVDPAEIATLVENRHAIAVGDGMILLSARALDDLQSSVINWGELEATSLVSSGGRITLEASDISLAAGSRIEVDGAQGGGEALIGGDWQGAGEMLQAKTVTLEAGAAISASATKSGDGGKVVLWSDIGDRNSVTTVSGSIQAKGSSLSGQGGQIETSGHALKIENTASVDAGTGGDWLIDPSNYVIDAAAATNIVNALNTGTSVTVTTTANDAALGSSGVTVDAGDISVTSDIVTGAMSGDAALTLKAERHVSIAESVVIDATQNGNTAKLHVKLWADQDNSGDGINILSGSLHTNGGSLEVGNGDTAIIQGLATKVGGDIYINGATAQTITTGSGDITIRGESILANTHGITFDSGGGDIDFQGPVNSGNQYTYIDGPDGLANSWGYARTQAINGTGGGAAVGDSYMVTITSRLENAIAGIASGYRGAWIGAYRDVGSTGAMDWVWADGPEAGQHFFTEISAGGGASEPGEYSNFGSGEPNGGPATSGSETVGQFYGTEGQWNDLSPTTTFSNASNISSYAVLGYVRETNLLPSALILSAGSGTVATGAIGGLKPLASLNVLSSGTTVNGNALITSGAQTFNTGVDVVSTEDLNINASSIDLQSDLLAKAAGDLMLETDLTTNGGDVILWANSDGAAADGMVNLVDGTSITTDGGHLWAGGGSGTSSWNGLTVGDGHAVAGTPVSYSVGGEVNSGISISGTTISTNGGTVALYGKSTGPSGAGIASFGTSSVDAGTGQVSLEGISDSWYAVVFGVHSQLGGAAAGDITITSNGTASDAITLIGDASATTNRAGIMDIGVLTLAAPAGGGIQVTGAGGGTGAGIQVGNSFGSGEFNVLANSGPIVLNGGSNRLESNNGTLTLGAKSGTAVTASTSDISLISDEIVVSSGAQTGTVAANSTGTLSLLPLDDAVDSFASAVTINNQWTLGSTLSGLTIGGEENTSDIALDNAQVVNGAIALLGGNVALNADLDTTSAGVAGDVLVKTKSNVTQSNNAAITTAGGDLLYWSDADADGNGYVSLTSGTSVSTGGGDIVVAGGADGDNNDLPDGSASGAAIRTGGFHSGISLDDANLDARVGTTFDANAGDVTLVGESTYTGSQNAVGVLLYGSKAYGNNVSVTGTSTDTAGTTNRYGISANGNSTPNNTNIGAYGDITLTGTAATPENQYSIRWGVNHELAAVNGDVEINSHGQLTWLSSQPLTLADEKSLILNTDYSAEWRNVVAGDGAFIKRGTGTAALTGQNTYTGVTDIDAGTLIIRQDDPSISTSAFNGPGKLVIEPAVTSFTGPFALDTPVDGLSGLTIGKTGNTADIGINSPVTVAGDIGLYGSDIDIDAGMTSTGDSEILIESNGSISGTNGSVIASRLGVTGSADVVLDSASNDIDTLSANVGGHFTYVDSDDLSVGTVNTVDGVTATGQIDISTQLGDLSLDQSVSSSDTSDAAVILNAAKSQSAGTASGGNILISNTGAVAVGSGGRASLYSGSVADSTGLTTLVGSGSGRFRYNSDEAESRYSALMGAGVHAVYRESPEIVVRTDDASMIYGDAIPNLTLTVEQLRNGDTQAQTVANNGVSHISGEQSSSGNWMAGVHTVLATVAEKLGYTVIDATGDLTVNQRELNPTMETPEKTYDGADEITALSMNIIEGQTGDDVMVLGAGRYEDRHAGSNKNFVIDQVTVHGADASNYSVSGNSYSGSDGVVSKRALQLIAVVDTKDYDTSRISTMEPLAEGLQSNDEMLVLTQRFDSVSPGVRQLQVAEWQIEDGNAGRNYRVAIVDATGQINALPDETPQAEILPTTGGTVGEVALSPGWTQMGPRLDIDFQQGTWSDGSTGERTPVEVRTGALIRSNGCVNGVPAANRNLSDDAELEQQTESGECAP